MMAFLGYLYMLFLLKVFLILHMDFTTGSIMSFPVAVCTPIIFWWPVAVQVGGVVGVAGAVSTR